MPASRLAGRAAHPRVAGARPAARAAAPVLRAAPAEARPGQRRRLGRRVLVDRAGRRRPAGGRRRPLWSDASFASVAPAISARRHSGRGALGDGGHAGGRERRRRRSPTGAGCSRTTAGSTAPCCPTSQGAESRVDSAVLAAHVFARGVEAVADVVVDVAGRDPAARLNLLLTDGERVARHHLGRHAVATSSSATGSRSPANRYDDDPRWVDVPDRPPARGDPRRRHRHRAGVERVTVLLDTHLRPSPTATRCAADVLAGLTGDAENPAAEVVLRRSGAASCSTRSPGCRSTTRPAPSAASLPGMPTRSRRSPRPRPSSSSAAGRRRRPGCCSPRSARRHAATLRPVRRRHAPCSRTAGETIAREYPGVRGARGRRRLRAPSALLPRTGRRLVAFLGSTIGNLEPVARREFLAAVRVDAAAGRRRSCSAPTW